jgi:hypothetical protein
VLCPTKNCKRLRQGSDEDDASESSSRDELEEIGETSAEVESSDESILWLPASISRRRDRSGVSIRDDCIRWTKDAQPGRHVDSNQTPIAQHQRRWPAEQCVCVCVSESESERVCVSTRTMSIPGGGWRRHRRRGPVIH